MARTLRLIPQELQMGRVCNQYTACAQSCTVVFLSDSEGGSPFELHPLIQHAFLSSHYPKQKASHLIISLPGYSQAQHRCYQPVKGPSSHTGKSTRAGEGAPVTPSETWSFPGEPQYLTGCGITACGGETHCGMQGKRAVNCTRPTMRYSGDKPKAGKKDG